MSLDRTKLNPPETVYVKSKRDMYYGRVTVDVLKDLGKGTDEGKRSRRKTKVKKK